MIMTPQIMWVQLLCSAWYWCCAGFSMLGAQPPLKWLVLLCPWVQLWLQRLFYSVPVNTGVLT